MSETTKPEYRELPVFLMKQKRFYALTPAAKAAYTVLCLNAFSYGLGQIADEEALAKLIGITPAEFGAALAELESAEYLMFDDEAGVYWLFNCNSLNLNNPKHQAHIKRTLQEFPRSPVIDAYLAALGLPDEYRPNTNWMPSDHQLDQREQERERERAKLSQERKRANPISKGARAKPSVEGAKPFGSRAKTLSSSITATAALSGNNSPPNGTATPESNSSAQLDSAINLMQATSGITRIPHRAPSPEDGAQNDAETERSGEEPEPSEDEWEYRDRMRREFDAYSATLEAGEDDDVPF